jgi:chemotaxis protein methyltransferase CheR
MTAMNRPQVETILYQESYQFTLEAFNLLRALALSRAGIEIPPRKKMMLYNRLLPHLKALNIKTFNEYYHFIITHIKAEEKFINLITNPVSDFFREGYHFEFLTTHLIELLTRKNEINMWSAGCSTGEEAYSIAMVVHEVLKNNSSSKIDILGSDIDSDGLNFAQQGIYTLDKINMINPLYLSYFYRGINKLDGFVMVQPMIRDRVVFERMNLIEEVHFDYYFDVIFCRNVLIYFSDEMSRKVLDLFDQYLNIGGLLILGHSENIGHLHYRYDMVGNTIYKKLANMN